LPIFKTRLRVLAQTPPPSAIAPLRPLTRMLISLVNASCACEAFAPLGRENEVQEDQAVAAHSRRRLGS
jgi:hypothetical protein